MVPTGLAVLAGGDVNAFHFVAAVPNANKILLPLENEKELTFANVFHAVDGDVLAKPGRSLQRHLTYIGASTPEIGFGRIRTMRDDLLADGCKHGTLLSRRDLGVKVWI